MTLNQDHTDVNAPSAAAEEMEMWALDDLHPHPLNSAIFDDLSASKLQSLADDIYVHGLQHAIEILPDGTTIAGHQRVLALRRLRETTVRCRVRHDLAAAGPEAVRAWMIRDNLQRRQMTPMAKARACEALVASQPREGRCKGNQLRNLIGAQLNVSGRHVSRYLRLLTLPRVLQNSVDAGSLPMTTASRIAQLPRDRQREIAASIEAGEAPAAAAATLLAKSAKPRSIADAPEPSIGCLASRVLEKCEELQRRCSDPIDATNRKLVEKALGTLRCVLDRAPSVRERARRRWRTGLGAGHDVLAAQ